MLPTLVLLWLGATPHTPAHEQLLSDWATAQHLQLRQASQAPHPPPYQPEVASEIELLLEEARSTIPDTDRHTEVFSRLQRLIADNPWLPQAAWLEQERKRILLRTLDPGAPEPDPPTPIETVGLQLRSVRPADEVVLDGETLTAEPRAAVGRHHVQLRRAGVPLWMGWVSVDADGTLAVPEPASPCSGGDLLSAHYTAVGPTAEPGVRCEAWVVAGALPDGSVQVAQCSESRCGGWELLVARAQRATSAGAQQDQDTESVPTWLKWSLLSVGSLAVTGVVLWQSGVFDSGDPDRRFEFTGPVSASF